MSISTNDFLRFKGGVKQNDFTKILNLGSDLYIMEDAVVVTIIATEEHTMPEVHLRHVGSVG